MSDISRDVRMESLPSTIRQDATHRIGQREPSVFDT